MTLFEWQLSSIVAQKGLLNELLKLSKETVHFYHVVWRTLDSEKRRQ